MAVTEFLPTESTQSFYYDPLLSRLEDILGSPQPVSSRDNNEPLLKPGDRIGRLNEAQLSWGLAADGADPPEWIENKIEPTSTRVGRLTIKHVPNRETLSDDSQSAAA